MKLKRALIKRAWRELHARAGKPRAKLTVVASKHENYLSNHGTHTWRANGCEIRVTEQMPHRMVRLVLAHELGHCMDKRLHPRASSLSGADEENFAWEKARELLGSEWTDTHTLVQERIVRSSSDSDDKHFLNLLRARERRARARARK